MRHKCSFFYYTGISDLYMVNTSLVRVVSKWQDLGLSLGLSPSSLEVIEAEHPRDTSRCMTETLAAWLQRQGRTIPSWWALVTALESCKGTKDITLRIAREHGMPLCVCALMCACLHELGLFPWLTLILPR